MRSPFPAVKSKTHRQDREPLYVRGPNGKETLKMLVEIAANSSSITSCSTQHGASVDRAPMAGVGPCLKAPRQSSRFFLLSLRKTTITDTLRATGAEDKPLGGSKLSADSGARPGWGSVNPGPQQPANCMNWDGIKAINPRGLGTESPEEDPPFTPSRPFRSFQISVLSPDPCLRLHTLRPTVAYGGCASC
jgi:hypothetical protein